MVVLSRAQLSMLLEGIDWRMPQRTWRRSWRRAGGLSLASAGCGSLTQSLTKTAAGLIHCRRADHSRQSARRPRRAEADHRHDGAGCVVCAGRDRPAEIPTGAISTGRVRPVLGKSSASSQSKPIAEALAAWADQTVRQLSRKSELAQAFRYMRARWIALGRCFDDGRLALDNNPAERALRCIAIGRKNFLFAGSDAGGRRAAAIYSLIESAKLNGLNPQHYIADLLARIADHPARRIAELLPWNWQPLDATRAAA